jgi:hypothetical protein
MSPTRSTPSSSSQDARLLSNPDEVTVLVFKDNDTSRSFQVSLGWITRLGLAMGAMVALAALSAFFALKFYRVARKSDPIRVVGLEQRIADLETANQGLEAKLTVAAKGAPAPVSPLTEQAPPTAAAPLPTTDAAPPSASGASVAGSALFSALPRKTQDLSADASKLPITVSPVRVNWGGRALKVSFNFQYVGVAHGNQQGRIIVLARGPNILMAYPEGVLNRAGAESLIQPEQGEFFSVSRFREVKADFPEIRGAGPNAIQDVEILIMSLEGQLLYYQKLPAAPAPAAAKPAPAAPKAVPAADPAATTTTPPDASSSGGATDLQAPPAEGANAKPAPAAPSALKKANKPQSPAKPAAESPPASAPAASGDGGASSSDLIEPGVDQ